MKKLKNDLYPIQTIKDLKHLVENSAKEYSKQNAFLKKNKPGGRYEPITYSTFKKEMDALGTALLDIGLKNKKIAVIGENRYEWILTYLSVVNGVGTIVPLDKELPANEIKHLLEKSQASAIIYSEKLGSIIENMVRTLENLDYIISMDAQEDRSEKLSLDKLIEKGMQLIGEGNQAYIKTNIDSNEARILLFTSGTTGLAKGVMLSHKNICSNVMAMSQYVKTTETDVVLSVLPLHHTYECTCGIMTPLYQGSCIAFCEGLKHIVKNMNEAKVTIMLGVPLIFKSMYKRIWKKAEKEGKAQKLKKGIKMNKGLKKVGMDYSKKLFKTIHMSLGGNLRMFISGGAAGDPEVIECFNNMGVTMFQGYGLTECSPIIAVNKDRYSKHASVGIPLPGTEVKILNPDKEGVGEVICKSDSVMIGYYKDEVATQNAIREGWLYTGDYGYFDEDGFLYITGRKKNVIVTQNGKNIFPEEVEYYLYKNNAVAECLVYGISEDKDEDILVYAEIVPDKAYLSELEINGEEEIYDQIKKVVHDVNEKIPLYKRIRRFDIRSEAFEKTTTQKIKRFGANIKK